MRTGAWPWVVAWLWVLACSPARDAAAQQPLHLTADSLHVVFWPGGHGMAERALRAARTPMHLPGLGRRVAAPSATIVLAPTPALFDSVTGGRAPEWSSGVAIPARRLIVLPAYPSSRTAQADPITALRHELVHLALHDHLGDAVPRWFDEGYATWAAGEWDRGAGWQVRVALLRGVAPPLDSLSLGWPESGPRARLAYLLAASAVEHLATRSGERAFAAFLQRWRRDGNIGVAMRATYLMTVEQFETEWRRMVRRRYGWLLAVAQVGFFWGAVTLLFVALGVLRRGRDRARLAAMEEEERSEPPSEDPEADEPWRQAEKPGVDDEWRQG